MNLTIEAVTVCVHYADFLEAVVPFNRPLLDRWIIVTDPDDTATREVCRRFSLDCVLSKDHAKGTFAKGLMIERGLQHLSSNAWRLHIDADIALPSAARHLLEAADLDSQGIYGCDRIMVRDWPQWQKLLACGWLHEGYHDYHCRERWPEGFSPGSRWVHRRVGFVPIGFFQLWHSSQDEWQGARIKPYPSQHGTACRTDVQHGLQWDRRHRHLLPELIVAHIESEPCALGANWKGRTTKPFRA